MLAWKTFRIFSLEGPFISELCPNLRGMFGDLLGMRFSLQFEILFAYSHKAYAIFQTLKKEG